MKNKNEIQVLEKKTEEKKPKKEEKMTLEEYQRKYNSPENKVMIKTLSFILASVIGIIVGVCLFFLVTKLFELNKYAGYVGIAFAVLIFIFLYLLPIIKIGRAKPFIVNTSLMNARETKRYNKALREEIADKMIDFSIKTEGITWYSDHNIKNLIVARGKKDDRLLKDTLTDIYKNDVQKYANKLIQSKAVQVGVTTALSQSKELDTVFAIVYDLSLIKDIVFMYGYRPSDAKMLKIYESVLTSALMAYGVSSATTGVSTKIGNSIVSAIEKASLSSNTLTSLLGSLVGGFAGTAFESSIQLVINYTLTTIIGFQTKKYLMKEYHLQDMLDGIILDDPEEEETKMIEAVKKEVKESVGKKAKVQKNVNATNI